MLARTYKTAAELGLPIHEFDALWMVVHSFEDGSLPPEKILMSNWCGTTQCIAGWAHFFDKEAFPEIEDLRVVFFADGRSGYQHGREAASAANTGLSDRLPTPLYGIFVGPTHCPNQAIARLRTYLETGE